MAAKSKNVRQAEKIAKFHAKHIADDLKVSKKFAPIIAGHIMQAMQDWHGYYVTIGGR